MLLELKLTSLDICSSTARYKVVQAKATSQNAIGFAWMVVLACLLVPYGRLGITGNEILSASPRDLRNHIAIMHISYCSYLRLERNEMSRDRGSNAKQKEGA